MTNYRFYYFMSFFLLGIGFYFFFYSDYPLFLLLFIGLAVYHVILARLMQKYKNEMLKIDMYDEEFSVRSDNMEIKITFNENLVMDAELNDTATAKVVYEALPIKGNGKTWGEEIYFSTSIEVAEENPREILEPGEIAYWPPLQAICFFYGPTPASQGEEIRAAGPVNIIGKIKGELSSLKELQGSIAVYVEKK